jgi:hypothetical protein
MKDKRLIAVPLLLAAALLRVQADQPIELGPPQVNHRTNPRYGNAPTAGSTTATTPITNHGGPTLATPNVYVIWYGNWKQNNNTDTAAGQQIIRDFLNAIGGSPYFNINLSYGSPITGNVHFAGEAVDAYSQGSRLTDQRVASIVSLAISRGLPKDSTGVYFVLTSSDVSENSGFCSRYCGWHTAGTIASANIKYSFVGNPARCLNACAAQSVSPNGNAGVDAMISVIAHELEETTTDPNLNAWYDSSGAENADKCAWTFGQNQYQVVNGAWANMRLGNRDFLIQRNLFHSTSGDFCATSVDLDSSGNIVIKQ